MCLKRIFFAVCTISCVDSWIGHAIINSFIFLPLSIALNCKMHIIYEAAACARTLPYLLKPGRVGYGVRVGSILRTWPHEVGEFHFHSLPKKAGRCSADSFFCNILRWFACFSAFRAASKLGSVISGP